MRVRAAPGDDRYAVAGVKDCRSALAIGNAITARHGAHTVQHSSASSLSLDASRPSDEAKVR
jgi:hypothetical protein